MTAVAAQPDEVRADLESFGRPWWLFLVAGILWMVIGFAILSFDLHSVMLISIATAVVLWVAAAEEVTSAVTMSGWRWLHIVLAVLFFVGGVIALALPGQTFRTLAILIGWFLLIRGTATICLAIAGHGMRFWWLALIAGILEIAIALWAIGYPGRSAWLLVVWAGLAAVFHGIGDIVAAFQVRHLEQETL